MRPDTPCRAPPCPVVFLFGPPGVGKSTLGSRACRELGLGFLDLAATPAGAGGDPDPDLARLSRLVAGRAADVIELPWRLQRERKALLFARRSGVPLLLWAHPEDMQARSGHVEPLFTPVARLRIRGGFGRLGTGCREFRQLDRACGETLLLVDLSFEEAAGVVRESIVEIREGRDLPAAGREDVAGWVDDWRRDYLAPPHVAKVIVDAMARYLAHLRATGSSPRTLSGVFSDLNAAGHLVLRNGAPGDGRTLEQFDGPPWETEFRRRFTDRPALVARYRRSLEGFARFLKECGDLPPDGE